MDNKIVDKIAAAIGVLIGGLFVFLVAGTINAYIIKLLWNWLVPELFHGPTITWLQAFGLLILSNFLVKGGVRVLNKN
jgi:hypothetical protein